MLKTSQAELELAKLLFDNQHKISAQEWSDFVIRMESENNTVLDDEFRLEIFKQVFADVKGHESLFQDYRL